MRGSGIEPAKNHEAEPVHFTKFFLEVSFLFIAEYFPVPDVHTATCTRLNFLIQVPNQEIGMIWQLMNFG